MRFSHFKSVIVASASLSAVNSLNILITNDDGFGRSNIREIYKAVKAFGHNVYIVASTSNESGTGAFVFTRQTGGADVDEAVYNATSGLFTYGKVVPAGANTCINGDCSLLGETNILNSSCQSPVSIFTVDYDAPSLAMLRLT
ncbi:Acid phosphatase [Lachnellula suecica]|uniref:Acid phosphatase n=1 Tax=Lachnellula suecica TaxID=602035 RepID=A0A8T9BTW8_9HELO|nr:Acid phosphatase [Lachnellula suecica]